MYEKVIYIYFLYAFPSKSSKYKSHCFPNIKNAQRPHHINTNIQIIQIKTIHLELFSQYKIPIYKTFPQIHQYAVNYL